MNENIREMHPEDWDAVADIYLQGILSNQSTFQPEVPAYADWDAGHRADLRFVAIQDDRIVGWAVLSPTSSRKVYAGVAELSVYVDSACHGQGIGSRLIAHMAKASEEVGIWTLQSGILRENTASVRLHEKNGFRIVGYREKVGQDRFGQWRDIIFMERRSQNPNFM